ncbi:MAG: binding-protein-dependent transport system inner rane component [Glaciihabitans sp.]|nr:binding-protein-dependent transport system inner rane component [Glaciihabitans sp.]
MSAGLLTAGVRRVRGLGLGGIKVGNTLAILSAAWLALTVVALIVPDLLAPGDPTKLRPTMVLQPPSAENLLGTEQYGRSVYLLLIHGARTAMLVGFASTAIALVIGSLIGLLAGYFGGWVDAVIGRLLDILMSIPGVLLALLVTASAGSSLTSLIFSVGIAFVAGFARVMRGQVLTTRERVYVDAARSVGFSGPRILFRHVLPNAFAPVLGLATVAVGEAILVASALSFLGLGPLLDVPDWGQMLAAGQPFLLQAWWVSTFAGITISVTVVAVSLLGDWLKERFD